MQYKVKIRLAVAGALGGELVGELPFTLTHPKPLDSPVHSVRPKTTDSSAVDVDLIQLDTK